MISACFFLLPFFHSAEIVMNKASPKNAAVQAVGNVYFIGGMAGMVVAAILAILTVSIGA